MKLKTLAIPADVHAALRIYAATTGQALGDVAAHALRNYVGPVPKTKSKKNGKR